jgi:hypothetical protein
MTSCRGRLELYPFLFRDRFTGKWVRARHKLQVPALQRRYAEWEIAGPAEIRHVTPGPIEHFNSFKSPAPPAVDLSSSTQRRSVSRLPARASGL